MIGAAAGCRDLVEVEERGIRGQDRTGFRDGGEPREDILFD